MASIDYPPTLPLPLRDGYGFTRDDLTLASEMDGGPPVFRRLFSAGPARGRLAFMFTGPQYRVWDGWFLHTLDAGAAWFNLDLLIGAELITHEVHILGTPQARLMGVQNWRVDVDVLVRELDTLSAADTDTLAYHAFAVIEGGVALT